MIMFITSDRPTATQLQNATVGDWGLRQLLDVHVFTLDAVQWSLQYCNWATNECSSIDLPEDEKDRCSNYERIFDVIFTGQRIMLMRTSASSTEFKTLNEMDEYTLNQHIVLPPKQYYAGIIGYNSLQSLTVSDWTWQRRQFDRTTNFDLSFVTMQDHFTLFGSIGFGDTAIGEDYVRVYDDTCLIVHNKPLWSHKGFSTTFTWRPICRLEPPAMGFSLFLVENKIDSVSSLKSSSTTGQIGTASVTGVTSISYNRTENSFYAYFGGNSVGTTFRAVSDQTVIECDYPHLVQISFATTGGVTIFVDGKPYAQLGDATGSIIERSYYYVGLSGQGFQDFSNWQYTAVVPQTQVIELDFDEDTHLELFGTAAVTDEGTLRLTTGGSESGAAMYPVPVFAHTGFNASITWTPTNCDAANNGADGFTLFLTKNLPLWEQVYNSAGGLLGIGNVPNTVMFAYSATFNEFYVCDWTVPHIREFRDVCATLEVQDPKYTCPDTFVFDFIYNHQSIEIRVNDVVMFTTAVNLEPVQYYVGVSGATGGGYFQQDISRWYFESVIL